MVGDLSLQELTGQTAEKLEKQVLQLRMMLMSLILDSGL